ncbi:MAG: hypothetical protein JXR77_06220 [Lentisphaeria bacterium]|nr:hypothetical protein [Lentisphaeria bacterium]
MIRFTQPWATRRGCLLVALGGLCMTTIPAAELSREGNEWRFGDDRLALCIDAVGGALTGLSVGERAPLRDEGSGQWFDVRQDDLWVTGGMQAVPALTAVRPVGDGQLEVTVTVAHWQVVFHYQLLPDAGALRRWFSVTWNGSEPTKLKGFWMRTPPFRAGPDTWYCLPGVYPPETRSAESFSEGTRRSSGRSPNVLAAQVERDLAVVWVLDESKPFSDRGSVTATETADGVRVSQGFQALARMRPGDTQVLGDAWIWILPCDGETALKRLGDCLRQLGHCVPPDRPDWFRDAVLYSLHPGGTIGSQFTDLGGFRAAADLLESIAAMGVAAVWIMPIEDRSPYHPRDYYAFQEGLGSAEEYRALVARAHTLGLYVLQDIVPHGGSNDCPRALSHPEWLACEEDGSTLPYWCFDFHWPTWQTYMADVARHYVREYGVDGYRVDACAGSRIPNWNPDIPYGRASFAQLQGGLGMLRALRAAVKETKPDVGGLLAETEGSIYATVSDAVYDFTLCYQVFPDARRTGPEVFVGRLRRWLHEQQAAEVPGVVRLRHVESHDSLRSLLCYGLAPQRALMAVSAWIDGMPLVYHGAEDGSRDICSRIFAVRRTLPELRRGAADYLAVQAPPTVFACLRSLADHGAIVLANLGPEGVEGEIRLPLDALPDGAPRPQTAHDLWTGDTVPAEVDGGSLRMPIRLPAFGFTVLALHPDRGAERSPAGEAWSASAPEELPVADAVPALVLEGPGYAAAIDNDTGLLRSFAVGGRRVLGPLDLYTGVQVAGGGDVVAKVSRRAGPDAAISAAIALGGATLELTYRAEPAGLRLHCAWMGEAPGDLAALELPLLAARRWAVSCAEGRFEDTVRPPGNISAGTVGSIYWRPQAMGVVFDSLLHPLGLEPSASRLSALANGRPLEVFLDPSAQPVRLQCLHRPEDPADLRLLLAWTDPEAGTRRPCRSFALLLAPGTLPPAAGSDHPPANGNLHPQAIQGLLPPPTEPFPRVLPATGGWIVRNAHYSVRLSRSGAPVEVSVPSAAPDAVLRGGDLYTDRGFGAGGTRYGVADEVEAAQRLWRDGKVLRLRFEGRLRHSYRFHKLVPPVEYFWEYAFDAGGTFAMQAGVRPHVPPSGESAFLGLCLPVPGLTDVRFEHGGRLVFEGAVGDGRSRVGETSRMGTPTVPDRIVASGTSGRLVELSGITCGGAETCRNVFAHGRNLFLTWYDGPAESRREGHWRWLSACVTPGRDDARPPRVAFAEPPNDQPDGLLRDGGFETLGGSTAFSLRGGPSLRRGSALGVWAAPAGGSVVPTPVHGGRLAAAVVSSQPQSYRLWRQSLPQDAFPEGSRWRLSAWVKGEGIEPGPVAWQVGTVRLAVVGERTTYVSCEDLTGTFDWRQVAVEWQVPPDLRDVRLEAGLNGATGSIWVDDLRLERLP